MSLPSITCHTSPKRILIFSLAYYPSHVSGAEASVREITDRIACGDIEFELITFWFDRAQPKEERIGNVLVHRVGVGSQYVSKILFVPLAAWTARRLHQSKSFDGMWALMTYMIFPTILARCLGVRVPYVITLQDGDPYEKVFERWFIRPVAWVLDYGFRHASVVQAISAYLATWPKLRGAQVPVELVHNGGNPNDFKTDLFDADELSRVRAELGVSKTDVLLGNTARLVYQKGWEDTIRSLTLLPAQVKLLVVGSGPDEQKYKDLVAELGLVNRVMFVGQVDRSVVTKYRRILDIFVMPSRSEGLGNAGLSAMASRIPVVATQEGGLAEYVFDKECNSDKLATAWVVDKNSPEQIAMKVRYIMEHPDEVQQVTGYAYTMVVHEYQWDTIAKKMRDRVFAQLWSRV
jgi:glycosyltransferase involved in cell wall biosynthesis